MPGIWLSNHGESPKASALSAANKIKLGTGDGDVVWTPLTASDTN